MKDPSKFEPFDKAPDIDEVIPDKPEPPVIEPLAPAPEPPMPASIPAPEPPVIEPAAAPEPPVSGPAPTIEELARENAILRHEFKQMVQIVRENIGVPPKTTAPTLPDLGLTFTQEEYDQAMTGPEGLAGVLKSKLTEAIKQYDTFAYERNIRNIPQIVEQRAEDTRQAKAVADKFYGDNPELKVVEPKMGEIFFEVLQNHPNATNDDVANIMKEVADLGRARFRIARAAPATSTEQPTGQPPVTGARRPPKTTDPNSIAAQLKAMADV